MRSKPVLNCYPCYSSKSDYLSPSPAEGIQHSIEHVTKLKIFISVQRKMPPTASRPPIKLAANKSQGRPAISPQQ